MNDKTRLKYEEFNNKIYRLFPEKIGELRIGGNFVRTLTIQVTEDCNMACTYCYQHNKSHKMMSFETAKKFIDLLLDADERSCKYITSTTTPAVILDIIGGEPLMNIEVIDQLTDYFIEQCIIRKHPWATNFRIGITTNGLLYFDPKVQEYIAKNRDHLSLNISIDGNKTLHDRSRIDKAGNPTYDRAMAAVNHFRNHWSGKNNINSKVTIAPDNIQYIAQAIIEMISNGYELINLNCSYEEGWKDEHGPELYKQLKTIADYVLEHDLEDKLYISMFDNLNGTPWTKNCEDACWCGGAGLMIGVDPDGNIYPCLRYMPSSVGYDREPFIIGTVDDGFLATPEQCNRIKQFEGLKRSTQCEGLECANCQISTGCGDCIGYTYEKTGSVKTRTTYHCITHKARVLASSYYNNKRLEKQGSIERYKLYIPDEWALQIVNEAELDMIKKLSESYS